jgi:hypothetical protein
MNTKCLSTLSLLAASVSMTGISAADDLPAPAPTSRPLLPASTQIAIFEDCWEWTIPETELFDILDPDMRSSAAGAEGQNLVNYKACLLQRGLIFDGNVDWWVSKVNDYCARPGTVLQGIGNDHNAYKWCLWNRGVVPSLHTVHPSYATEVNKHCWGEESGLERALETITMFGIEAVVTAPLGLPWKVGLAKEVLDLSLVAAAETGLFDFPDNPLESLIEEIIDLPPYALMNYPGYKQCLEERNVGGLKFKPFSSNPDSLASWAGFVGGYCIDMVVNNRWNDFWGFGWHADALTNCLRERAYPEGGVVGGHTDQPTLADLVNFQVHSDCSEDHPISTEPFEYLACVDDMGGDVLPEYASDLRYYLKRQCDGRYPTSTRGANAAQYLACLATGGVTLTATEAADLNAKIDAYCDGSYYTGGRLADYNAYFRCFTERGTTFDNDSDWKSGVRNYCAASNMIINKLDGYKRCLSERKVSYVESYWRDEVKEHCDGSYYTGGRFADYNAYFRCFTERGTTFVNDTAWQNGVRTYCGNSNVQFGKLTGYKQCLSERKVSYLASSWCPVVKKYCEAQWYPFGGKDLCYSERGCTL